MKDHSNRNDSAVALTTASSDLVSMISPSLSKGIARNGNHSCLSQICRICPEAIRNDITIGPIPVILMSLGRSGSGATWQVTTALTGRETPSDEYTGATASKQERFFFEHTGEAEWLGEIMCNKLKMFAHAGVVGIKWKPHRKDLLQDSQGSVQALEFVRDTFPWIKLIRSRRNALDVALSRIKHRVEAGAGPLQLKSFHPTKALHRNKSSGWDKPDRRHARSSPNSTGTD